ncbi:zinc finger matrin-type protein [Rhynchospora pubera]|uniref:Zinc finger matrin-type protein n=1 Tax=Rhynchospora pubera TaxID=906938 RepID=A0AAV8H232_9POAL|nr:zinc finger matrin-type protein [Rhynchospora pubera]
MILSVPANTLPLHLRPSIAPPLCLSSKARSISRRVRGKILCKAELIHDAPFALALGASVLSSLVLPTEPGGSHEEGKDDDGDGAMDSTDTRLAVMAIISIIPYFNCLGWVFAWMDTGKQRYLVYSIVYLAPYLRTNFSLSPEESWLPIASILICILHVQLETSIKNGDVEGFKFPFIKSKGKSQRASMKKHGKRNRKLPPSNEAREKLHDWGVKLNPRDEMPRLDETVEDDKFS